MKDTTRLADLGQTLLKLPPEIADDTPPMKIHPVGRCGGPRPFRAWT